MYHIIYIIGVDNVYIYIYIYVCIYIDHLHGAVTLEIDADAVHDLLGTEGISRTFTGFMQNLEVCTISYVDFKCKNINFDYFSVGFQN